MANKDKDQVLIPMVTTIEAALDYGYSLKDIRQWRIGNRMCTIILVPGTKEQYDSYLSSFSKEFKAEDRDKRCQISDGKDMLSAALKAISATTALSITLLTRKATEL
ncbi:MAG: hypothetical protein ACLTTZ_00250 [Lachnospiraceae bacterium]